MNRIEIKKIFNQLKDSKNDPSWSISLFLTWWAWPWSLRALGAVGTSTFPDTSPTLSAYTRTKCNDKCQKSSTKACAFCAFTSCSVIEESFCWLWFYFICFIGEKMWLTGLWIYMWWWVEKMVSIAHGLIKYSNLASFKCIRIMCVILLLIYGHSLLS